MALMDIYALFQETIGVVNTQQGGCLKPTTFVAWLNAISTELFNEKFGDAETSQMIDDQLKNAFLKSVNIATTHVNGRNFDMMALPADFGYMSAVRVFLAKDDVCACLKSDTDILVGDQCTKWEDPDLAAIKARLKDQYVNEVTAKKVDDARFGDAATSIIMKPTLKSPIVTQINGGIKIVPSGIGIVVLDYYRLPAKAFMSFTTVAGTDVINYNLVGSTQLDWPDLVKNEILARMKMRYGSFTRNTQQYSEGTLERKQTQ